MTLTICLILQPDRCIFKRTLIRPCSAGVRRYHRQMRFGSPDAVFWRLCDLQIFPGNVPSSLWESHFSIWATHQILRVNGLYAQFCCLCFGQKLGVRGYLPRKEGRETCRPSCTSHMGLCPHLWHPELFGIDNNLLKNNNLILSCGHGTMVKANLKKSIQLPFKMCLFVMKIIGKMQQISTVLGLIIFMQNLISFFFLLLILDFDGNFTRIHYR